MHFQEDWNKINVQNSENKRILARTSTSATLLSFTAQYEEAILNLTCFKC